MLNRARRLAAAVSLLLVVAVGAARGAELTLPPFSQWETITGGAKVALEDGRIVFTPAGDGKTVSACVRTWLDELDITQDLLLDSAFTLNSLNAEAVPAIRLTVLDADGKETLLLDSGIPKQGGAFSRRRDLLAADRLQELGAKRLRLDLYIYNFTSGVFTVESIRATARRGLSGHDPAAFDGRVGGLCFNEDCTQVYAVSPNLDVQKLCDYLDYYLVGGHQIREMMLNPNCQRASYASGVFPPMWDGIALADDGTATAYGRTLPAATARMIASCKSLNDRGIDPYVVWIDHLRKRGVSPWISMRMNDSHDTEDDLCWIHGRLWREHPEWRIGTYRKDEGTSQGIYAQGLNYAVPEVRAYVLAFLFELLERYDMDGLELDFMRFGRVFAAGAEVEGRAQLTELVAAVRAKADEMGAARGHRIRLSVRVPTRPDDAYRLGYDVGEWCERKLVDMVTPTNFLFGNDPALPLELWRRIVGDDVLLAPGLEVRFNANATGWFGGGAAIRAGMAADWLHRGADRIYLFNHMGRPAEENREIMSGLGKLVTAAAMERRHYVGFADYPALGRGRTTRLPLPVRTDDWETLRIGVGPKPEPDRKSTLIVGFADKAPSAERLEVRLNAKILQPCALPDGLEFPVAANLLLAFDAAPAIQSDDNTVEIKNLTGDTQTIVWSEIHIAAAAKAAE